MVKGMMRLNPLVSVKLDQVVDDDVFDVFLLFRCCIRLNGTHTSMGFQQRMMVVHSTGGGGLKFLGQSNVWHRFL